jgi:hypothetical protein
MGLGFMALGLLIPQLATGPNAPPPQVFTILFGFMGAFFLLFYGAHSAAIIVAGRYLQQRRRWLYCVIVASLDCMSFPFGTALGVCTFLVLARPTVQAAFRGSPLPPVAPPSLPTAPLGA